jgi:hypothetical protein
MWSRVVVDALRMLREEEQQEEVMKGKMAGDGIRGGYKRGKRTSQ